MIDEGIIDAAKQVPITEYLDSLGHQPIKMVGYQFVYNSPLTEERTGSFFVHPGENVFNCFSSDERGDIIRLIRLLNPSFNFLKAIEELTSFNLVKPPNSFSFSGQNSPLPRESELRLLKVKKLENKALIQYLTNRGIPYRLASIYVSEAYFEVYENQLKPYFALCFLNDKGGYELRSKIWKGCTSPKYLTTIEVPGSRQLNIFEGFINFLSALVHYRQWKPQCTTVILNSTSFLSALLPTLHQFDCIQCFFDNGYGGKHALSRVKNAHSQVIDKSYLYQDHEDFNDFLNQLKK